MATNTHTENLECILLHRVPAIIIRRTPLRQHSPCPIDRKYIERVCRVPLQDAISVYTSAGTDKYLSRQIVLEHILDSLDGIFRIFKDPKNIAIVFRYNQ